VNLAPHLQAVDLTKPTHVSVGRVLRPDDTWTDVCDVARRARLDLRRYAWGDEGRLRGWPLFEDILLTVEIQPAGPILRLRLTFDPTHPYHHPEAPDAR
jgi:hypothetical protein